MKKSEAVRFIAESWHESQSRASARMTSLLQLIVRTTAQEGRFAWPGIGVFRLTKRKARKIQNPVTGKPMKIPAKKAIAFRQAGAVSRELNR